jgi:hypothetical protein
MSQRFLGEVAVTIFVLMNLPTLGAENNGTGPSKDELEELCLLAEGTCFKACRRSNTVSGTIQQSYCEDECKENGRKCVATIAKRKKNTGTTGIGTNGRPAAKSR